MAEIPIIATVGEWFPPFERVDRLRPVNNHNLLATPNGQRLMNSDISFSGIRGRVYIDAELASLMDTDMKTFEGTFTPMGPVDLQVRVEEGRVRVIKAAAMFKTRFTVGSMDEFNRLSGYRAEVDLDGEVFLMDISDEDPESVDVWGQLKQGITTSISSGDNFENLRGKKNEVWLPVDLENPNQTLEVFKRIRMRFVEQELS